MLNWSLPGYLVKLDRLPLEGCGSAHPSELYISVTQLIAPKQGFFHLENEMPDFVVLLYFDLYLNSLLVGYIVGTCTCSTYYS